MNGKPVLTSTYALVICLLSAPSVFAQPVPHAVPFDGISIENAAVWQSGNALYVELKTVPDSGQLTMNRLANVVRRVKWLGADDSQSQTLKPETDHWTVDLKGAPADSPAVLEFQLNGPAVAYHTNMIVEASADGTFHLHGRYATVHGEKLRYEPQSFKNTVGYWTVEADYAEWHFRNPQPGRYFVSILQGCGKGHGGSQVQIDIAGKVVDFSVEETGHFQNFIWQEVGQIEISAADDITLKLHAIKKKAGAVMDCREIQLRLVR